MFPAQRFAPTATIAPPLRLLLLNASIAASRIGVRSALVIVRRHAVFASVRFVGSARS